MQKPEEVFQDQFIKLNVGGTLYHTSLSTLLKDKDSMLAAMFSGRHKVVRQQDDSYFIDRDGKHFRYILNFLRGSSRTLPDNKQLLGEIAEEAEFYQLQGLLKLIKMKIPESFSSDDKYLSTFNQVVIIEQNTNHNHATIRGSNLDFLSPTFLELANRTHTTDVTYSDTFSRIQISLRVFDKMGWFQALYDHHFCLVASVPIYKNTIEYIFHNVQSPL